MVGTPETVTVAAIEDVVAVDVLHRSSQTRARFQASDTYKVVVLVTVIVLRAGIER